MKIIVNNNERHLIKNNNDIIKINDGEIIQYTAIFYRNINDNIETKFIGIVETHRYRVDIEITGIYVKPLYIWYNDEWNKIINFKSPTQKYFLYPHLLMLPQHNYVYRPLHFLHTCESISLDEFVNITKTLEIN